NLKVASDKVRKKLAKQAPDEELSKEELHKNIKDLEGATFAHHHNYSQLSILQSTDSISDLLKATADNEMPAVSITDRNNMMGAFHFVKEVGNHNKAALAQNKADEEAGIPPSQVPIKPIVGCTINVCENHLDKSVKDNGYQIVMLAKNKKGYHNLAKMSSIAYTEGFYYVPRIDKKVVEQYKEDIIVLTGNLYGEVPSKLLNVGEVQAEDALLWWKQQFGEDLYVEVIRHNQEDENRVNGDLIKLAQKHGLKLVATNNTYYISKEDANAHDILLCVKDGEKKNTPIGRGRGYRYGLPNQEYYYKSSQEMKEIFKDIPDAIYSIEEIIDKVEPYELARDVLLPAFDIPEQFQVEEDKTDGGKRGENKYLKHLTYQGAKRRYAEITEEIKERLDFELSVIENTGYPGYFLIVQDFIAAAREMDVSVGPGRGS